MMKKNNIDTLSELTVLSEDSTLHISRYGRVLSVLACNDSIDDLGTMRNILLENISNNDFPVILNTIHEHLERHYQISEFKVEKRKVNQKRKDKKTDPQKSRLSKMVWKKNKGNMMKGLNRFHKSSKGKAFHKALGKFVSSRTKKHESLSDYDLESAILSLNELRISLSSAITQLLIDIKTSPESYSDFSSEDFNELMDVYGEAMKDLQDAYMSGDPDRIEDSMDEVIAEFASVLVGIDMEFIYNDEPHDTTA